MTPRRRLDPAFRSWLVQQMYMARSQKIADQVDRFEIVADALCHTEQRMLNFELLAEDSGYGASLLRDTASKFASKFKVIEISRDHEGVWYSLKVDPFSPPSKEDWDEDDRPDVESQVERLYRECCDEVNSALRQTVCKLEGLRGEVEPAVGALLMDACADILTIREKLTRIAMTGVQRDRSTYIAGLREDLRGILGEGS